MTDYTRITHIQEGVWEIVDERGDSVFSTHCTDCKNPFFFGDLRLLECKKIICQNCKELRTSKVLDLNPVYVRGQAQIRKIVLRCKNYSTCGEQVIRSQMRENVTCVPCRAKEQQRRDANRTRVYA